MVRTTTLAIAVCLFLVSATISRAQEPPPTDVAHDATSVTGTTPASTATTVPTAEPTVELPTPHNTPLPPTATPALPEEGGPPGGVLGGYVYRDADESGSRTPNDIPIENPTLSVYQLNVDGGQKYFFPAADASGRWELRGLADGSYRVIYAPVFRDPSLADLTDPPIESVTLSPNTTLQAMVYEIEIAGANRVLNLHFRLPLDPPPIAVGQQPIGLPQTGTGARGTTELWLLGAMIGVCAFAVVALTYRRVRR